MKLRLHAEVEPELREASRFYEDRRRGLGESFVKAIWRAFDLIQATPKRFPAVVIRRSGREIHRFKLNRFPYLVVYEIISDEVIVLAVAHGRRRARYWARRKPE